MTGQFFIFGVARSGTNLLARMLDLHPNVTVALDPFMGLFRAFRNEWFRSAGHPIDPTSPFFDCARAYSAIATPFAL